MTTDAKILSALRGNADGISGAQLRRAVEDFPRGDLEARRIEELRKVGFVIEAGPHFGYRIVDEPDALLVADDLLARLAALNEKKPATEVSRPHIVGKARHPGVSGNEFDE